MKQTTELQGDIENPVTNRINRIIKGTKDWNAINQLDIVSIYKTHYST
jgi:hypothetical protein